MRNHKRINITLPKDVYDWLEGKRGEIYCNRSRFISECLRDVLYLNDNVRFEDREISSKLRIIKGK